MMWSCPPAPCSEIPPLHFLFPYQFFSSIFKGEPTLTVLDFKKEEISSHFLAYNSLSIWNAFFPVLELHYRYHTDFAHFKQQAHIFPFVHGEDWLLLRFCAQQGTAWCDDGHFRVTFIAKFGYPFAVGLPAPRVTQAIKSNEC